MSLPSLIFFQTGPDFRFRDTDFSGVLVPVCFSTCKKRDSTDECRRGQRSACAGSEPSPLVDRNITCPSSIPDYNPTLRDQSRRVAHL